ncbi:tyrosine-type recombinase/integrase [Novosphingobium flavum]|uniref:Tyrosine-type recombinase/integrase n=1 Tax=Novosphingobium aerophilum TaxID=2839843 RepID=A0A7X1F6H2_9SPHN|nr:tyrosine-type recombinase/integrase [Novosphingobium aerophilum]MBC2651255.1 tyrosine-type recombinase/integrase [Novosphingobium aerophilum]MBC2661279.1 tyrosine-type recombinase/integrase [Novosphingobium aerophilum]
MQTPVLLALYTGQRREDLVTMTWADYHGGIVRVAQNKTQERLDLPCHPKLREHLDNKRTGFGGTIVRAANGRPMTAGALSAALNRAMADIAEMPHRSWHGLRYLAAGKLEEAGCSVVEITSVIGHRTYQMAMQYISQRRAARAAIERLEAAG